MHTIQSSQTVSYTQRQAPLVFDKLEDKTWQLIESEARENCPDLYELIDKVNNFNPDPDKEIKRYVFTTFHQSFGYEDFIEGIKPVISDDETNIELAYTIEDGIFKQICSRASSDPANRYAIFIDEINRGNVSAVFGELITLIEKDKRIGMENELKVKLPYSKKDFGVPANLDIYGTMNTADRSVEALDTALRRRFSFTEMPPLYDLPELAYEFAGFQGKDILRTINQRIEKLLDRDHLIGHSYFLKKAEQDTEGKLMDSFYRNIIPLLQEYFYGDYAKIGAVLGAGFVYKSDDKAAVVFAAGFGDEDYNDKAIYQIIDYLPEQSGNQYVQAGMTFEEAIKLLMPKQSQKEVNA
jgi:5-methylcytosine-specific restriction endonuclease McrBC GTP-binding regulatory subunit McrB